MTRKKQVKLQPEYVLEDIKFLWTIGAWSELASLSHAPGLTQTPEILIYVVSALYQIGESDIARALLKNISLDTEQKALFAKVMLSGTLNSLGKAAACNQQHQQAEHFFSAACSTLLANNVANISAVHRAQEQYAQLGIPYLQKPTAKISGLGDTTDLLQRASSWLPDDASIQVAIADSYQQNQQFDSAIVSWQKVSALLDENTPQPYYDRLKDAYRFAKSFPQGSVEQEALKGDIDKHKLLSKLHKILQPEFYFEIGVQTGKSLALAKCEALGVDPMPMLSAPLGANAKVITSSSDAFFKKQSDILLTKSLDLVFIDGMHLFEYALRDFINVEKYASADTIVVIDDIFPGHPDQANRNRCTRAWTGDVWKVKAILEQYRPDLTLQAVDAYPTGLLLISNLDSNSSVLQDNYEDLVRKFFDIETVPQEIMERTGAVSVDINNILSLSIFQKRNSA